MPDRTNERRVKQLLIAPELLLDMFKQMTQPVRLSSAGLPNDARLVTAQYDAARNCVRLLVYSDQFASVLPEQEPPYLDVTFTRHDDALDLRVEGLVEA